VDTNRKAPDELWHRPFLFCRRSKGEPKGSKVCSGIHSANAALRFGLISIDRSAEVYGATDKRIDQENNQWGRNLRASSLPCRTPDQMFSPRKFVKTVRKPLISYKKINVSTLFKVRDIRYNNRYPVIHRIPFHRQIP